jgi:hypothetical protein
MKLLGMEVFPRRRTDAEYVQLIRKAVSRSKWFVVLHAAMTCFYIAAFIVFPYYAAEMEGLFPASAISLGVKIGILLGLLIGVIGALAVMSVGACIKTLIGWRTERLMLKFHDELEGRSSQGGTPTP